MKLTEEMQKIYENALNNDPSAQYEMYLYHKKKRQSYRAYKWLKRSVKAGFAVAQNEMGLVLQKKYGSSKKLRKIRKLFKAAAMQGLADAQYNYALLFDLSYKPKEKELKIAYEWCTKAAEQNHKDAIKFLKHWASILKYNDDIIKWSKKLFDLGDIYEAVYLAQAYENGSIVPKDDFLATLWYSRAVSCGMYNYCYKLGMAYYEGKGVEKSFNLAFKWLSKALEHGDSKATKALIKIRKTDFSHLNYRDDIDKVLESAAEKGDCNAQMYMGEKCYLKDAALSIQWYKRAAEHGTDGEAECTLGEITSGYDLKEALQWHMKSFEKGNYRGIHMLCKLLETAKKYDKAYKCAKTAADKGLEDGYRALSECYYSGYGVEKNLHLAHHYAILGNHNYVLELLSKQSY